MAKMFYENDGDLDILKDKTIAIIGYGSQGHAQAQNLRDSGISVLVSELPGTPAYERAQADKFEPMSAAAATKEADIIQILIPDTMQSAVYRSDIQPHLSLGKAIGFSHGFNIHFGQIKPPEDIDVIMVAPKGPGPLVRSEFLRGAGVPVLVAVYQDASGTALDLTLAYARGVGGLRAGAIMTTFAEETETDLFGEQTVLCGGVTALVTAAFEVLVEAGYQPELAYFECLHELKLIVDLFYRGGISLMRDRVSDTAEYGDLTRGPRIVTEQTKQEMRRILEEVQSGEFAREWIVENQANRPVFNALQARGKEHLIEKVGARLRSMMSWIEQD